MSNERLRSCIGATGLTISDVAAAAEVDPKTVERWITTQRVPHRRHRQAVASLLRTQESYLWPDLLDDARANSISQAEVVSLYPNRGAVPWQLWTALLDEATEQIDVLVYSGLFLPDVFPDVCQTLIQKSEQGVMVRLSLGDPASDAVRMRGEEEGIGDGMAGRISLTLTYLRAAIEAPTIDARLHGATLYNSIFRFDFDMLVNTHIWGAPAAQSPVLHLRKLDQGHLFRHYQASFDRVWNQAIATPANGGVDLGSH